ncbi:PIN domain-containing protein [Mucilaginibacter puniceus]
MRSIFLDSDILLDLILERDPFYEWALGVFLEIDKKQILGCTSVHALLNVHYLAKKKFGEKSARALIKMLTAKLSVIKEDNSIVQKAIDSDFVDFEDAVQYYAAISGDAEVIITRNIKDYQQATIPVLTAEQFLRMLYAR